MKTYVVGDIHGSFKSLVQAIERSPFDREKDRLITIGDYIDGGWHIEIMAVIEYLTQLPNWIGLLGNHDSWLLNAIHNTAMTANKNWLIHGAKQTLVTLGIQYVIFENLVYLRSYPPQKVSDFLDQLQLYFIDDQDNVFLHGGWRQPNQRLEESDTFKENQLKELYWDRDFWYGANHRQDFPHNKVFIGHTSSTDNPERRGNIWNLDSAATHGGPVTIMDVETEQYWQSDPTSELYEDFTLRSGEKR